MVYYLVGLVIVAVALFLLVSVAFGRGEELAPLPAEISPVRLPADRLSGGDDIRKLRFSVVLRGYRMGEVDWVLEHLAEQLDERDAELIRLRSALAGKPVETEVPEPPIWAAQDSIHE